MNRTVQRAVVACVLTLLICLWQTPWAWACICGLRDPPLVALTESEIVFIGTVAEAEIRGCGGCSERGFAIFHVDEAFAGISSGERIEVTYDARETSCTISETLDIGGHWLIFIDQSRKISLCSNKLRLDGDPLWLYCPDEEDTGFTPAEDVDQGLWCPNGVAAQMTEEELLAALREAVAP